METTMHTRILRQRETMKYGRRKNNNDEMQETEWERERERERAMWKIQNKTNTKKWILMSVRRVVINGKRCSICTHTYFALRSQSRVSIRSKEIGNWAYVIGSTIVYCKPEVDGLDWAAASKKNELKWGKDKRFFQTHWFAMYVVHFICCCFVCGLKWKA